MAQPATPKKIQINASMPAMPKLDENESILYQKTMSKEDLVEDLEKMITGLVSPDNDYKCSISEVIDKADAYLGGQYVCDTPTTPLDLSPADNTPHTTKPKITCTPPISIQTTPSNDNDDPYKLPPFPDFSSNSSLQLPVVPLQDQISAQLYERKDRFGTYINYGFGVPFSYWEDWDIYPFVEAKYNNLKDEILHNTIYPLPINRFTDIYTKGQELHVKIDTILGNGDKNTPFARNRTHWNNYCQIAANTAISLQHLLSILFYTDLSALPMKMKIVCRKKGSHETVEDVKKRHVEFVHWLKSLTETLIFYGNRLSHSDSPIYHGLSARFLFDQFKARFHIPTSTTTDRGQAACFAGDDGIVLEFGGLESAGDPYFDVASISAYPHEKEYLFFRAELNIVSVRIAANLFSMAPLSLYQSIINGSIIIDKVLAPKDKKDKKKKKKKSKTPYEKTQRALDKLLAEIDQRKSRNSDDEQDEDKNDDVHIYGVEMLENFIEKNTKIYINQKEIMEKIRSKPLRKRFIEIDEKDNNKLLGHATELLERAKYGVIQIYDAQTFQWTPDQTEFAQLMDENNELNGCCSKIMKLGKGADLVKFYCQMNLMENEQTKEKSGRFSLILWKFGKKNPQQSSVTISCDFFCKQMEKYYVRFHTQRLEMKSKDSEEEQNTRVTAVFEWEILRKAFEKKGCIEWMISIRKEPPDDEKKNDQ